MILKGIAISGRGEASFFVLSWRYQKFFREILGVAPYPGTLNIRLRKEISFKRVYKPNQARPIRRARVRRINSSRIDALALIPGKSRGRVIEIVASVKLRNLLDIDDGKEVMLSVEE